MSEGFSKAEHGKSGKEPVVADRRFFADYSKRVFNDVVEMLPNIDNPSPLVRINHLNPVAEFQLFAKLEWLNPFGSVKDRAAWVML